MVVTGPVKRVLIVEDDGVALSTFAQILAHDGFAVTPAVDGESALREVDAHEFDAAIIDLRLPAADGLAVLRELRAKAVKTPAAIVTGDYLVGEDVRDEAQRLGAEVVFKPLWADALTALARRLTAR